MISLQNLRVNYFLHTFFIFFVLNKRVYYLITFCFVIVLLRRTIKIGSTEGSGKIFYEPDEADDMDEEDPDDDLDV